MKHLNYSCVCWALGLMLLCCAAWSAPSLAELSWSGQQLQELVGRSRKIGRIRMIQEDGESLIDIRGTAGSNVVNMGLPLPKEWLNRCFLVTVEARGNTSDAQVMLSEGFLWGSNEKVRRFIRRRLPGDEKFNIIEIPFEIKEVPFYVNCGVLWNREGGMQVRRLAIREISREELMKKGPVKSDKMRFQEISGKLQIFKDARTRMLQGSALFQKRAGLPPEALRHAEKVGEAMKKLALRQNEVLLKQADRQISEAEKILVCSEGRWNPGRIQARDGQVRMTLYQCHCPYSVWVRLDTFSDGLEFRLIAPDGGKYRLNTADLVNIPCGEAREIEISGIRGKVELSLLPLDHVGSETRRVVMLEAVE